uniref:50S ribosomal protein L4 n=1 Tax=Gongylonema pulchrum TaxID=637853 RepID=A0A183EFF7_9BILA
LLLSLHTNSEPEVMSMSELINLSLDEIIARGGAKFRTNFRRGARRGGTTSRGFRGGTQRIPVITNRIYTCIL